MPPLARILKIDVNTLLAFNEELTDVEVKKLTKEVGEIESKEGFQKVFEKGSDLIKQYPSCDELILMISEVLRIYLLGPQIEDKDKDERKIISWLELVAALYLIIKLLYKEKKFSEA
ncbi:hypothetical protein [Clostridium sp.]|uniref:hypothetical protein n=1 Tax=Clostridium sp. TaxID=1506 RepID=UPI00284F5AAB|nr:hypothetical protein [Clostridium sp.]MDR3597998.1 hypothetical protein [Clostridium sp.]